MQGHFRGTLSNRRKSLEEHTTRYSKNEKCLMIGQYQEPNLSFNKVITYISAFRIYEKIEFMYNDAQYVSYCEGNEATVQS